MSWWHSWWYDVIERNEGGYVFTVFGIDPDGDPVYYSRAVYNSHAEANAAACKIIDSYQNIGKL